MTTAPLSRMRVLALAWPVILAQAATATTGVVDTIVMGSFGDKYQLGAVGVAAAAFGFIYWGFGFLRMSTTGLTAQAVGAGKREESRATLQRSLMLALVFAAAIIILFPLLKWASFAAFQAEEKVEALGREYFNARIWGAPALLMTFGITGWLLGTGRTREMLALQIVMNGVNAGLDWWFVAGLGWGPAGIGAGTAIAEWVALAFGLWLVRDGLKSGAPLRDPAALKAMFMANRDIMIRTLALLFSFAWFVNAGARQGTAQLAGNEVLLQFITVAAFVLDGFAFIAEKEVGEAFGAKDVPRIRRAVRVTSELAVGFGALTAALFLFAGGPLIEAFVRDAEARDAAIAFLPYCAAVPLIGVVAWQLDGVFLGATQGRALRTAAVLAMILYVSTDWVMSAQFGNTGVWIAFLMMYVYRAICLGAFWPGLMQRLRMGEPAIG